jgi:predicted transcriptional regulator
MDDNPKYKQEKWLYTKYWDEGLTQTEMAKEIGVTTSTISNYMRRFNVPTRTSAESRNYRGEGLHDDAD